MKAVLIFNPASGKGRGRRLAERFSSAWKEGTGEPPNLRPTRSRLDIRAAGAQVPPGTIPVFMGGDGTLSEGLQGMFEASGFNPLKQPVGLLPGGTGNSFLRDFKAEDFDTAVNLLINAAKSGRGRKTDIGLIEYHPGHQTSFTRKRITLNIFALGLIPRIAAAAVRMRFLGPANYTIATLWKILFHRPERMQLTADDSVMDLNCDMIAVCNSRFTGGKMIMAPSADLHDGRSDYIVSLINSRLKLLSFFPRIFSGRHLELEGVRHGQAREIRIKTPGSVMMLIDGELETGSSPRISTLRNSWELLI